MSNNKSLLSGIWQVVDKNAPTLATFGSIIGVGLTIYFSHKAAKKAAEEQVKYEEKIETIEAEIKDEKLTEEEAKEEKSRAKIGHLMTNVIIYRWALLSGFASGGLAALSNWLNGRTIAGIAAIVAAGGDKWKIAAKKVEEVVGKEKLQELKESINKEFIEERAKDPKINKKVEISKIVPSEDSEEEYETYWDTQFGYPFEIHPGVLKDALARAERVGELDYATWRGYLGLSGVCKIGYDYVWTAGNPFKAHTSYISIDGEYVKSIVYDNEPDRDKFTR